jgi:hypothetical protein
VGPFSSSGNGEINRDCHVFFVFEHLRLVPPVRTSAKHWEWESLFAGSAEQSPARHDALLIAKPASGEPAQSSIDVPRLERPNWLGRGHAFIILCSNELASREVPGKTPGAGYPFTLPQHAAHHGIAKASRGAAPGVGPWDFPA